MLTNIENLGSKAVRKPSVSFIMPAYNVSSYIWESIFSVINQTEKDWELLIIDDCSTDNTLQIANEIAGQDPRIRVFKTEVPSGSALKPRKIGIENAYADFVAPLDADDLIEKNYLEKLLKLQRKYNADIVFPTMYNFDGNKESLYTTKDKSLLNKPGQGKDFIKYTLNGWGIGCNGGLINRQLYLKATQKIISVNSVFADELETREMLYYADKVIISDATYLYRSNPGSITNKFSIRTFDILLNNQYLINFTKEKFSKKSVEYKKAQLQNFYSFFHLIQYMKDNNLSNEERALIKRRLLDSKELMEFEVLEEGVNKIRLNISKLPLTVIYNLKRSYKATKDISHKLGIHPNDILKKPKRFLVELNQLSYLKKGTYKKGSPYDEFYQSNYKAEKPSGEQTIKEGIICMCDGKMFHGGLTDRLRGILTIYQEAKKRNLPFYIFWDSPFNLEEYLVPKDKDWRIEKEEIIYNNEYSFPFINDDEPDFYSRLRMNRGLVLNKAQIHVYSNADNGKGKYKELYSELFCPTEKLSNALNPHLKELGQGYEAYTFRFLKLLGDFEDWGNDILKPFEAQALIKKCGDELLKLINDEGSSEKIFVTSDSKRFLNYIKNLDNRIYIVEGNIGHIDFATGENEDMWLKTFIDQHLLMNARKVTRMRTHRMYKSGFPRFAAEVGGAEFIDHIF